MNKVLSTRQYEMYKRNAEVIKFLRRNPVIACELLLGIKLMDSQKWILQNTWNTKYNCWTCSRNFGKSFLLDVIAMLKMLLYPNMKIYIVSSKGNQAQETFSKLEDIAKQRIDSIPSLKDIFFYEVVKSANSDGFIHDKASFKVTTFNISTTFTLNSIPDNIRGKRSQLLLFDESAFCTEELISVVLPFITQNTDFKISTEETFDIKLLRKEVPTQVIFSSSAGDVYSRHFSVYREYAKKMIAGDSNYFVADIPCDIPLSPLVDGEPAPPLLTKQQIDDDMRINPDKALREYYNKFQKDGGETQMIKWTQIRRNETFDLPKMCTSGNGDKFAVAFDPSRSGDNAIIGVMEIKYDDRIGYYGDIVNCVGLLDIKKKKKMQMKAPDQIDYLKKTILDYNGNAPDYENIEMLLIDAGAGGGGTNHADYLLEDWVDNKGIKHKGFIDADHDLYKEEAKNYPNASRKLNLVSPQKYRTQMCEELIELMDMDLIKFPKEYNNKGFVNVAVDKGSEREIINRQLSLEEEVALINIDIMKSETTSIHKMENAEGTNVRYALPKDKEKKMHDDRFYALLMLGHYLHEKRRQDTLSKGKQTKEKFDINKLFLYKQPSLRSS